MNERAHPFVDEMAQNVALGADLLGHMVRANALNKVQPSLPPAPVWEWFVHDVVYRFIQTEQQVVMDPDGESEEGKAVLEACLKELIDTINVCAKNQQLGLQSTIQHLLRARLLYLPINFDGSYGGAI